MTLRVGSLFSGVGGLELGLERAGMEVAWQVEIDPFCRKVLAKHWPNVPRYEDVTKFCRRIYDCGPEDENGEVECPRCKTECGDCACIGTDQLLDECGGVDLICGGFPCQDLSLMGKGKGLAGSRSGLWSEFARIVGELQPRYVLVENVPALLGRGLGTVLGDLASLGYDAEWDCISAASVGAPHRRDRLFIVAHAQGESERAGLREGESSGQRRGRSGDFGGSPGDVADAGSGRGSEDDVRSRGNASGGGGEALADSERPGLEGHAGNGEDRRQPGRVFSQAGGPTGPGGLLTREHAEGWWRVEPGMGRVAPRVPHRVERLRALGNSVVPQVSQWIGERIMEAQGR